MMSQDIFLGTDKRNETMRIRFDVGGRGGKRAGW
jgi:hypothetical protein